MPKAPEEHVRPHVIPHLPIKLILDEANELIMEELDENNWGEIEVPVPSIEMIPYYVFHYDSFSETEEEGSKIRNVEESVKGVSSLNAVKNSLDDVIAQLVSPETIRKEITDPKGIKIETKEPRFSLDDAKGSAQIKIAAQEKVPRGNVHILGMRLVYVPFWIYKIEFDEETIVKVRVNAFSGEFEGEETGIPYQGRSGTELLKETVGELQTAEGWADYLQNFIKDLLSLFTTGNTQAGNKWVIYVILIVIAIVLLGIGFIEFPAPE